jgi:hypothetical protein|tara:strand:+ start:285 stop:932 length:648 start_codon:yes stop_codon:yes gene_type:complete
MIRSIMSARDIEATYNNTFLEIKTRDSDDFYPIKVIGTDSSEPSGPIVLGRTLDGGSVRFPLYSPDVEVRWEWPELGMRNFERFVVYVSRQAQRQFRRGVREGQLDLRSRGRSMAEYLDIDIHYEFESRGFLQTLFNPKYPSLDKALEQVNNAEVLARAFSPCFAVEADPRVDHPLLIYKETAVGVFKDGVLELDSNALHLQPMIQRIREGLCPQ